MAVLEGATLDQLLQVGGVTAAAVYAAGGLVLGAVAWLRARRRRRVREEAERLERGGLRGTEMAPAGSSLVNQ